VGSPLAIERDTGWKPDPLDDTLDCGARGRAPGRDGRLTVPNGRGGLGFFNPLADALIGRSHGLGRASGDIDLGVAPH
jgi:hypothetical protein